MYCETKRAEHVRDTIAGSCIPLLCGSVKAVRRAARVLYGLYGLPSYAILTGSPRLPLPFYLRRIPTPSLAPHFLAEIAVRFFEELEPTALPVLIDCTEERFFLTEEALRCSLESRCFLSDLAGHKEIPPFCYLSPEENEIWGEGRDRSC